MASGNGFFDGNPLRSLVWLAVVSVVVGFVFVTLNIDPLGMVQGLFDNLDAILRGLVSLFGTLGSKIGRYFLVGVVIVVPLWLIGRLIAVSRRR